MPYENKPVFNADRKLRKPETHVCSPEENAAFTEGVYARYEKRMEKLRRERGQEFAQRSSGIVLRITE